MICSEQGVKKRQRFYFFEGLLGVASSVCLLYGAALGQNNFAEWEKYDFTPGDTILFYDDFSADPLGAFPEVWDLVSGECEVMEFDQRSWLRASEDSEVDPYLETPLPAAFAVEFDAQFLRIPPGREGHWQFIFFSAGKKEQCELTVDSQSANFLTQTGSAYSAELAAEGLHRLAVLFEDGHFRCYLDNQRLFDASAGGFQPASLRLGMFAESKAQNVMFTNFRITGKRKSSTQLIYENRKWVCYGIYFEFGQATLRGQSLAALQTIGELLQKDPALNLRIEDHTNDKEEEEDNLRLSQLRAEMVRDYLLEKFKLSKDRVQMKAWGAARPLGPTDTPDGIEMNRRVEFVKM
jgi:hypothetical protein